MIEGVIADWFMHGTEICLDPDFLVVMGGGMREAINVK